MARRGKTFRVEGQDLSYRELMRKYGVEESLIRGRHERLGWTIREAVGLDPRTLGNTKGLTFRGVHYTRQEDLYAAYADDSTRAVTTMRINMAAARKRGPLTDEAIEEVLFGKWDREESGGILYELTCIPTGLVYIGITVRTLQERWNAHVSEANYGVDSPLKRAIREYGTYAFAARTISTHRTSKTLKQAEQKAIRKAGSLWPDGLNANLGGTLGSIDRRPLEFDGRRYRSVAHLERELGYRSGILNSRMRQDGMTLEEAVDYGPPRMGGFRPKGSAPEDWIVDGITFPNQKAIADHYGISVTSLRTRLSNGTPIEEAVRMLEGDTNCAWCQKPIQRRSRLHKYCSAPCKEAARSVRRRESPSRSPNRHETVVGGKKYSSDVQVGHALGINRQRFRALIRKGMTPDEAAQELLSRNP